MSTTLRIVRIASYPETLDNWLNDAFNAKRMGMHSTYGTHGHCFEMYDLVFHDDADAVIFKLTFPNVVLTEAEVALTNTQDDNPNADKSRLWEAKMAVFQTME